MPPRKIAPNPRAVPKKKMKIVPAVDGAVPRVDRFGRQVYRDPTGTFYVRDGKRIIYVRKTFPKVQYRFG
ncbi:PBCV-specific basic adaptor domain-containing protein [Paramecium bursaria Chlorella virus NE-JV-4]|nr:PBCV-specific basic adaptor domain-containing protein [Paramecium bursaria Chlorella virus NE-JV-4]